VSAYANLSGDLDANPSLLQRAQALAAHRGEHWVISSGKRSFAEQSALYARRAGNPFPVAQPGHSRHETGNAIDVLINGRPIQSVVSSRDLQAAGLSPLAGDAVHVELGKSDGGGSVLNDALRSLPGPLQPFGQALAGAPDGVKDKVTGAVTGAAADAAKGAVGVVFNALGESGARVLLYVVLIVGGTALATMGLARAFGARVDPAALAQLAITKKPATRGAA
jgi:hypothetical protein